MLCFSVCIVMRGAVGVRACVLYMSFHWMCLVLK